MNAKIRYCLGPVIFCILDGAFTLYGQPETYWRGEYGTAIEWNPLARWLLDQHPVWFISGIFIWILLFCILILLSSKNIAPVLSFAIQFGHTAGAASWLVQKGILGWVACVFLFLISRFVMNFFWPVPSTASKN